MVVAINECVLPIVTYSYGIINWREAELKQIDINIRKLLHLYKVIQIKNDTDRLYGPRSSGGRGLISVWDSFKTNTVRIAHYINSVENETLRICCRLDREKLFSIGEKAKKFEAEVMINYPKGFHDKSVLYQAKTKAALSKEKILEKRIETWKEKPQHGAYRRQLDEVGADKKESFGWLNKCFLDTASEGYIFAAQEMALFTKYHESKILRTHCDATCRICRKPNSEETIYHLLAACDSLAKREYFTRHNAVCKYLHFIIGAAYGLPRGKNWYLHEPKEAIITKDVDILYDQVLTTDLEVGANRPDIVIKDKTTRKTFIIDVCNPCDLNIHKAEATKVAKYIGLKGQLQKMWGFDCTVIPVVIGGLGAVTPNLKSYLSMVPGSPNISMCQKITLLGSKKILMDALSRSQ